MNDIHDDDGAAWLRSIGRRLRIARLTADLTQEELGRRTGTSRSFVSLIEKGSDTSVLRLWRLADALGVPLVDLLGGRS